RVADRNLTAQVDLTIPFTLGRRVAGYLKGGGKHRDKHRDRDRDERQTPFAGTDAIGQETGLYSLSSEGKILLENFVDEDFDAGSFLEGRYEFGPGLDVDRVNDFWEMFKDRYQINRLALLDNYVAAEAITAGYVMAEINLGQRIMLLPGFRYESTENTYDASVGQLRADLGAIGEITDTTGGQTYGEFLPMVHLRLKLTPQLDVRVAVTRTLSRPDYFNLVPFERISTAELTLVRGNPDLRHTTAWNYDLYVSLYNRLGLLTVGVYYKTLDDIDYIRQTRITEGEFSGYQFTFPENGEESNVVGLEIDLQTNLRFLPAPLDGVVLNANYAFADSETFFPFLEIGPRSPDPPFQPTLIDTARAAQIPGQARHVANVSVGYEKGGFSGRLSVQYLEKSLFTVGSRAELDGFTDDSVRWDLALSQRFSRGLSVFLNANNRVFILNSIVSNIGTTDDPNNGRVVDDRGNPIDTLIVENSTFYNITSRVLRDAGGPNNYVRFNHNTMVNIGQFGVSFGETREAIFTNNLVINAGLLGNAPGDAREVVQLDSLTDLSQTQIVDIRNNNIYIDPAVVDAQPDSVTAVPFFSGPAQAFIDAAGTGATILNEAIDFTDGPAEVVSGFYGGSPVPFDDGLPDGASRVDPNVDVSPFDFGYSDTAQSATASIDGQPLGALSWFGFAVLPTAAEDDVTVPGTFRLLGNYPNPFNPVTTLLFKLETASDVTVTVYDLLGRQVLVAPAQPLAPGTASVRLDASNLASGVYLYRVTAEANGQIQFQTGRMVLLK
ncbi:MAG: TonB-dependent receptor, partial [Bacteroidetes bacterium]|nr:TonB-dependent receptor [Bacteroidota bacterium]